MIRPGPKGHRRTCGSDDDAREINAAHERMIVQEFQKILMTLEIPIKRCRSSTVPYGIGGACKPHDGPTRRLVQPDGYL